ncbi:hypothetical protein GQF56_19485 [Rhodobacter sphaeroides]|nr:hypothetical protein [Cereibacter sphaeroides]
MGLKDSLRSRCSGSAKPSIRASRMRHNRLGEKGEAPAAPGREGIMAPVTSACGRNWSRGPATPGSRPDPSRPMPRGFSPGNPAR